MMLLRRGFGGQALRMRTQRALLAAADALVDAARVVGGGAPAARDMARTATPSDRYRETVRATVLRMLVEASTGRKLAAGESSIRAALDVIDRQRGDRQRADQVRALDRRVAAARAGAGEAACDAEEAVPARPPLPAGLGLLLTFLAIGAAAGAAYLLVKVAPIIAVCAVLLVEWWL